ncbi:MAG TPA: sensor domain-containing diguanylate cyclase [Myxococcales bacterium]|jgi:diguanylate cyclase (GGDEF)-like protein|nr:sensor domain-containing diguanylate cyclase [Myxococcales bacterium]
MQARDLLRQLQRTVDELAVLNEIGKALTSSLDIGEVMHIILAKVSELLKPRNWSLLLRDQQTGELYFKAAVGAGSEMLLHLRLQRGEGIAGWVAEHNAPLIVDDVNADPRFAARFDKTSRFHTKSILCVPLAIKGRVLGVIELVNGEGDGSFSTEDLRILSTVAEFSAIAIENAQNFAKVQELTVLDDHTGLFNSRHLKRTLDQEIIRATRFGHPVSLVFFDLDYFKRVNDTYGHQAGSKLLAEVGRLLLGTLRSTDVPVRYGGDEFVVLLPETSKDQAMECAKRLRAEIAHWKFLAEEPYGPLQITASLGVASFPDDARAPEELLRRADDAMYRVKAERRDGVAAAVPQQAPVAEQSLTPGVSS